MNESRDNKAPRKSLKAELRVSYGPSNGTLLTGFCIDLSAGGLYLQTDFPLEVGERLILRFTLPDQAKSVSCNSRVAWVNTKKNKLRPESPPGAGIQFIDISLEEVKSIYRFLKHNEIVPTW